MSILLAGKRDRPISWRDKGQAGGGGRAAPGAGLPVAVGLLAGLCAGPARAAPVIIEDASGTVTLREPPAGPLTLDITANGREQWKWQTSVGKPLSLYAYAPDGGYIGNPLTIDVDGGATGSKTGRVAINGSLQVSSVAAPGDTNGINTIDVRNVGHGGAAALAVTYRSAANDPAFDVALDSLAIFNPTEPFSNNAKYQHFFWAVSPKDSTHSFGIAVAEWNITNRGLDDGWKRDRSTGHQTTGGLLLVPEVQDPETQTHYGLNVGYGFATSQSGGQSIRQTVQGEIRGWSSGNLLTVVAVDKGVVDVGQAVTGNGFARATSAPDALGNTTTTATVITGFGTGKGGVGTYTLSTSQTVPIEAMTVGPFDHGRFYNNFLCEPNATAGETGRCVYATGDITGTPASQPYAPVQIDGAWKHGVDTTLATFNDGAALHLASGQKVYLDTAGQVAVFYEAASGKIVFSHGDKRLMSVDARGDAVFAGTVTPNGAP